MKNIRNLTFTGANGSGKTSLLEQILHNVKKTNRRGTVTDGTTVSDFTDQEKDRGSSIYLSLSDFKYKKNTINIIDTPGFTDFLGEQICAFSAVESNLIILNATKDFEPGLELTKDNLDKIDMVNGIVINKIDKDKANFSKTMTMIKENLEITPAPITIPIGEGASLKGIVDIINEKAIIDGKETDVPDEIKDTVEIYRTELMEAIAETSEELLDLYFEEGTLPQDKFIEGISDGISTGKVVPIFTTSAKKNIGIDNLLNSIVNYLPSPADRKEFTVTANGEEKTFEIKEDGPLIAYIFKTISDKNLGDMAYVKVLSGQLETGEHAYVTSQKEDERIGNMYRINGKNREDTKILKAGEIGGLVKLKYANVFDTLSEKKNPVEFKGLEMTEPVFWRAIKVANQKDEEKIGSAISKIENSNPSINVTFNKETSERIIAGLGDQQLNIIKDEIVKDYKIDIDLVKPKIPHKETISGKTEIHYKHKKQSGGRGQYGDVYFRLSPQPRGEGFKFLNNIVGGSIPSKFIPAVEKGLNETIKKGIISGNKVVDVCVDLYFGSYHDVDSSEQAFKIASSMALKKGFEDAKPILLEPYYSLEIIIPNEYMGDVMGDISTRRGKIDGMKQKGSKQILTAEMPLDELFNYYPALKSLTQGRGKFTNAFSHFQKVPSNITKEIMEEYQKEQEN